MGYWIIHGCITIIARTAVNRESHIEYVKIFLTATCSWNACFLNHGTTWVSDCCLNTLVVLKQDELTSN